MAKARPFSPDRGSLLPSRALAIRLHPPGERAIREGHPWVFDGSIRSVDAAGPPPQAGDVGVVFDRKGRFLAVGLYDPDDPIRLRILHAGSPRKVGAEFFAQRLRSAMERRAPLLRNGSRERGYSETNGFRVVNGEGDGLPGVVLDRYGESFVLKLYARSWLARLPELVDALVQIMAPRSLLGLVSRRLAADARCPAEMRAGALLHGSDPGSALPFLENGFHLEAHPLEGHKTGFYLDQRENRQRVEEEARKLAWDHDGLRILNVFSYSGGFSLYGARGALRGAGENRHAPVEVTSVDVAGPALRQAERHFEMNGEQVGRARHRTLEGDAFRLLGDLDRSGDRFHLVVVDPPSFATRQDQEAGAIAAYSRLTRAALPLLESGGTLVQASCSSRVSPDSFYRVIRGEVRRSGRQMDSERRWGHPLDHPVGPPESEYLKCLFATIR